MDGLAQVGLLSGPGLDQQRTLKTAIDCVGVALHSGAKARLTLMPAPPNSGIVFRRLDLPGSPTIVASHERVVETHLSTVLGHAERADIRVGTVEHLLAALAGAGIDNVIAAVDGPEVPVLDGSAANFLFLLDCAGTQVQAAPVATIEILRPVRVAHEAAFAELLPPRSAGDGMHLSLSIDFEAAAIGRQTFAMSLTDANFRRELARARTFTLMQDVERLRAAGLARGGNLGNAIVVDGERVLNAGGLRMVDEFVRHKMLDAVGDLALAGAPLSGRFVGHCSGHSLNNLLLRAVFADPANWRRIDPATDIAGLSIASRLVEHRAEHRRAA